MKEKILIVHNRYQFAGGEDTVVKQDMELLANHGHQVFLYQRNNEEIKSYNKVQKALLAIRTIYSRQTVRELRKIIREEKIDVVHVHNTLPLISLSCYDAAKKEKCVLIQTLHNFRFICPGALLYREGRNCEECLSKGLRCSIQHKCYRNSRVQTALSAFLILFHRKRGTFRKPDHYIALTEFQKNKMIPFLPAEKIVVKPNYIEKPVIDETEAAKEFLKKNPAYYVYVGRLEEAKGIRVLLEAFQKDGEKKLLILGSGPMEAEIKHYLSDNQVENVIYKGFTPHEEAMFYLQNAKAMILPTLWYEGFPMTIVESLAVGTPVIASDSENIASIIDDGKQGYLFHTGNAEALRCVLDQMEGLSEEQYQQMQENAEKSYQTKYTPEVSYQKLLRVYQMK